jgi:hypothetical protein
MRIGSVPAATLLGDEVASLYVGAERVPTVPSAPTITLAQIFVDPDPAMGAELFCEWTAPEFDGGLPIFGYEIYLDGIFVDVVEEPLVLEAAISSLNHPQISFVPGAALTIRAYRAEGDGPVYGLMSVPAVTAEA